MPQVRLTIFTSTVPAKDQNLPITLNKVIKKIHCVVKPTSLMPQIESKREKIKLQQNYPTRDILQYDELDTYHQ